MRKFPSLLPFKAQHFLAVTNDFNERRRGCLGKPEYFRCDQQSDDFLDQMQRSLMRKFPTHFCGKISKIYRRSSRSVDLPSWGCSRRYLEEYETEYWRREGAVDLSTRLDVWCAGGDPTVISRNQEFGIDQKLKNSHFSSSARFTSAYLILSHFRAFNPTQWSITKSLASMPLTSKEISEQENAR